MRVIIIEDEKPAAEKLSLALNAADPSIVIEAVLGTVQGAVEWLQKNQHPDLIFMDIQLSDGLSFAIIENAVLVCPVIFTTAFDEYWQEAFEHNGIDYLLKPLKQEKLEAALLKFSKLQQFFSDSLQRLRQWQAHGDGQQYKKRFLVKRGTDYVTVKVEDIAYFYATHKLVCMVDNKGQKFILDKSLTDLEKEIDPVQFYRLNRKFLVSAQAIKRIKSYPKSKLLVEVLPPVTEEIIISQENVQSFKEWAGH